MQARRIFYVKESSELEDSEAVAADLLKKILYRNIAVPTLGFSMSNRYLTRGV